MNFLPYAWFIIEFLLEAHLFVPFRRLPSPAFYFLLLPSSFTNLCDICSFNSKQCVSFWWCSVLDLKWQRIIKSCSAIYTWRSLQIEHISCSCFLSLYYFASKRNSVIFPIVSIIRPKKKGTVQFLFLPYCSHLIFHLSSCLMYSIACLNFANLKWIFIWVDVDVSSKFMWSHVGGKYIFW